MNSYIFRFSLFFVLFLQSSVYGLTFTGDCNLALGDLHQAPVAVRTLASVKTLKIINYNLENFRVIKEGGERISSRGTKIAGKSPELVLKQRELIEKWDPDILTAEEVFDEESLHSLVSDQYAPVLIEGNDQERHIAFVIKKDLPYFASVETHNNDEWTDTTDHEEKKLFSRDLPVLLLRAERSGDPVHIIIGNHGKSRRDRRGDRNSQSLREAQYVRAAQIVEEYKKRFPQAGIFMAGDFNADTRTAEELEPIKALLQDPFDLKHIPYSDRVTHVYFPHNGPSQKTQMDNIFVSPNIAGQVLSVRVIPYDDEYGDPKPQPTTYQEREENGSDHGAVELVIKIDEVHRQGLQKSKNISRYRSNQLFQLD